jgi:hypothetical protein
MQSGEDATLDTPGGVSLEGDAQMCSGLQASPMESHRGEMLAAARPPCFTAVERESEVAIARATIHLIRAYELLVALDRHGVCLASLPRFGDLNVAVRSICLALVVLADEGSDCDHEAPSCPKRNV